MTQTTLKWKKQVYDPSVSLVKVKGRKGTIIYIYTTENINNWDFQVVVENRFMSEQLVNTKFKKKEFPTREDCIPLIIQIMEDRADDLCDKEIQKVVNRFEPMLQSIKDFKLGK